MWYAILDLACLAVFLELAARAPLLDDGDLAIDW